MSDQQTTDVQETMRGRLAELRRDYQRGESQLQQLMRDEAATRDGLLRAGGAIRILEEMLASTAPEPATRRDQVVDGVAPGAAP
ncbi:hypothetical protein ACIP25_22205 [Streptomyces massasporeus]|uniref:hypothetical protein n=1 Tax=Streptomyces massasporeus TaxID=67324 RepID=UPI0038264C5C